MGTHHFPCQGALFVETRQPRKLLILICLRRLKKEDKKKTTTTTSKKGTEEGDSGKKTKMFRKPFFCALQYILQCIMYLTGTIAARAETTNRKAFIFAIIKIKDSFRMGDKRERDGERERETEEEQCLRHRLNVGDDERANRVER